MNKKLNQLKDQMDAIHIRIPDAFASYQNGEITRREFIRFATLLGMSAAFATSCTSLSEFNGIQVNNDVAIIEPPVMQSISRGGTLTIGTELQSLVHPATLGWPEMSNIVRQVAEYLTFTDENNTTTPHLLESWETNRDVSEWTLRLQRGIRFNNGDELTADDVMFNFGQWLDPTLGSSMLGLFTYLDGMNSVEKVDDYTIKLNLTSPNIGVPEHLFHYPAAIMHRGFQGDFVAQPIGTGPFLLTDYVEKERAVLTRRTDYWQLGEDGTPLPYLDNVVYVATAKTAAVSQMLSGQIDTINDPRSEDFLALKDEDSIVVKTAFTAQTLVVRTRVDQGPPWDDVRVRQALRKIQDRDKILSVAYLGQGDLGVDAHVAPAHPAYYPMQLPEFDPEGARLLLEEWSAETGISLPIRATIATKNDAGEKEYAEILQADAAGTGFEFDLDITEPGGYWNRWTEVSLGISSWIHRPLDTMVLSLAYIADSTGVPVPWNETRWVDPEFSALLREAEASLNIGVRREIMGKIMRIFQERGPIGLSFFKYVWRIHNKRVRDLSGHPTRYDLLSRTWVEPEL